MNRPIGEKGADAEPDPHANSGRFLDGYISEHEYARQRGISLRTAQRDRQIGQAPPFITLGKRVYYRVASLKAWLLSREQEAAAGPARPSGKTPAAHRY